MTERGGRQGEIEKVRNERDEMRGERERSYLEVGFVFSVLFLLFLKRAIFLPNFFITFTLFFSSFVGTNGVSVFFTRSSKEIHSDRQRFSASVYSPKPNIVKRLWKWKSEKGERINK